MNSPNDNTHTPLGVVLDKKICIQSLGKEVHSKSKLHSLPQADRNWKPINAFATCLGRQMGAPHSICTQVGPKH